MRKALIATIVAMVLFAVGAFAATLTLSDSDLASGTAAVKACNTSNVTVVFGVGAFDAGDWPVKNAQVTAPGCAEGTKVQVVVGDGTNSAQSNEVGLDASAKATVTFPASPVVKAKPANTYSVRVGGILVP